MGGQHPKIGNFHGKIGHFHALSQNMVYVPVLLALNLGDDGLLTNFENNCLVCVILDLRWKFW